MADDEIQNIAGKQADNEPIEEWRIATPGEKPTLKFFIILSLACLVIVAGLLYLYAYIVASGKLNTDYTYLSVGYGSVPDTGASILQGQHVATTRGCQDCHGQDYGGKILQDNLQGRIVAPNLTAGNGSAVTGYFIEDWVKAIKHGIGRNNKALLIMPSADYNSLSDDDLLSMIAFLKHLPPVDKVLPKKRLTPLTYVGIALGKFPPIAATVIDHSAASVGAVRPDTTVAYGQYIAAACIGCHGAAFKGAAGPNLTSTGDLGHWAYEDFNTAITHGRLPTGKALQDAMPWKAFASMNETELKALFKYLKSLK
jgi:mono/diheme cytochrome c family protein